MVAAVTSGKLANRPLTVVLIGIGILALVVVLILALIPHPTIVEVTVEVSEFSFVLLPPRPPQTNIDLLDSGLKARSLEIRRAERLEITPAGGARQKWRGGRRARLQLRQGTEYLPSITVRDSLRVTVQAGSQGKITIQLDPIAQQNDGRIWQATVQSSASSEYRACGFESSDGVLDCCDGDSWCLAALRKPVTASGGELAGLAEPPASHFDVVDLSSGEVTMSGEIPIALPEVMQLIADEDRLIVLTGGGDDEAVKLFEADLEIAAPRFHRRIDAQRYESFLRGGQIRFP